MGLAEVSVPPGVSCRHLSLPALQPWAQGGGGEAQLVRPGRRDLTPYLLLSRQGWPYTALTFRSWWHLSGPASQSSAWSLRATQLLKIKEVMWQVGSPPRNASISFFPWDTETSCPELPTFSNPLWEVSFPEPVTTSLPLHHYYSWITLDPGQACLCQGHSGWCLRSSPGPAFGS